MAFDPLIPAGLWLILTAVGVGLLVWYAVRKPASLSHVRWAAIVSLMGITLALALGILLNPTWTREITAPAGKPVLTVLLDDSGSMSTADSPGAASRYTAAAAVAGDLFSQLQNRFDVQIKSFDQILKDANPASMAGDSPTGPGTDISNALNRVLAEERAQGQAVVLLSDGIDNTGGGTQPVLTAVRAAKSMGAPIYTRTFGGSVKTLDLALEIPAQQDLAVLGQTVTLTARVSQQGFSNGKATVRLLQGGKEIARREVVLTPNGPSDARFQITSDKVGNYSYEVRVDPLAGETNLANNSAAYRLRVVDEPMRVLVLEGKPYWDSKFFTRTLMNDPAIALDSVVQLASNRLLHRTLTHQPSGALPNANPGEPDRHETWKIESDASSYLASLDRLRGYQVIVIGRDAESFLTPTAVANLKDWVSKDHGSLLCYRGSPTSTDSQKLEKLLPLRWTEGSPSRFRVVLTQDGKDLNWFSNSDASGDALPRLPSLAVRTTIASSKAAAVVLANGVSNGSATEPAIVFQYYGTGKVMVVEGSGMWRWAFLAPDFQAQDQAYGSLWHSMMRWLTSAQGLAPSQMYSLNADKTRFTTEESATATLLARSTISREQLPQARLRVEGSNETKNFAATPAPGAEAGVFKFDFGPLPTGQYTAQLVGAKPDEVQSNISFDVRQTDPEMQDLQARPDLMARIANDSGGAVLGDHPAAQIIRQFNEHQSRLMPPRFERTIAWDRWWVLLGIVSLWTLTWAVRRTGGLV